MERWSIHLATRRLSYRTHVLREFVPPAPVITRAYVVDAIQLVLDVAAALGRPERTAPVSAGELEWGEPTASATCQGATERRFELPIRDARVHVLWRTMPDDLDVRTQLVVDFHDVDAGPHDLVQVFVWRRDRGHVLFGGPIERETAASAVVDRWVAAHPVS